jgi:integrase
MKAIAERKERPGKEFTAKGIDALKPEATKYEIRDHGGKGLYVSIQPSGSRSFVVRYRCNGKPGKVTLPAGTTLADARIEAGKLSKAAKAGNDPAAEKKQAKQKEQLAKENTFAAVAIEYLEQLKIKSKDQVADKLHRLVIPVIGQLPIAEVGRSTVRKLLNDVERSNGPRSADLVLSAISGVLKYHEDGDDDYRSPIKPGMRPNSVQMRQRVLTDDEIKRIWNTGVPFVRFLLLTGARRGEAAGMQWGEIDPANNWICAQSRNKAGVDLLRPLSAAAMDILNAQPRRGSFVFGKTPGRPLRGFVHLKRQIDVASGVQNWKIHDTRRTSRTLMSRARVDRDAAERCLGHIVGSKAERTYDVWQYRDEKAHAFETLAALIKTIVSPPTDNVVPLRA